LRRLLLRSKGGLVDIHLVVHGVPPSGFLDSNTDTRQRRSVYSLDMRRLAFSLLVVAISGWTQTPQGPPPVVSPEVLPGNRVVFRLRARNAKEVLLAREGARRVPMAKDTQGVWSIATDPLEPDYYGYSFIVDGVALIDPMNPMTRSNLLNAQSVVHVPGAASLPWETNRVPHGIVHHHFYRSQAVGDERDFFVYTPPGYDARATIFYPVLYLQHGYSGDARGWLNGPSNVILDNLIAEGKARPMLLVMSLGYGVPGFVQRIGPDLSLMKRNYDGFRDALLTEVIPEVEKSYRVAKDRNSRALAGLSMGGAESLYVGLNAANVFAWIGSFSAGGMLEDYNAGYPSLDSKVNDKLRLLWIACGTDDPLIDENRKFREWLTSRGVKFTAIETPGMHTWMVWRRNLAAFAPLLFR
jgi:enterochelin esterase-like enzyme